ncbi:APC family permease [Tunturiibacter gelidoferens]|uniref:Amino acid transporter n=1 Tax=Tunturiibacter lichenicola TaxID=2051959 RepID=A0A7Y9T630_9BACT|nr:APC family permease [Edaphobacter lichenicola]NYF52889.1 amino acid transporter [Edaphobacter lichenicola]
MTEPGHLGEKQLLKRELGLFDLTLFYIAGGLSLRWIATAAAAGPSTILVWIFACLFFFVPLAASVLELSARYPEEGGLYVWTQRAFGDFSGFLAAWTYWMSNLPYFPAVLYFGAGSLLFAFPHGQKLAATGSYYLLFALGCLAVITVLNVRGLKFGKWLNSVGAFGSWIPIIILLVLAGVSVLRFGSATKFTAVSMTPHADLKNAIFWSTIFFAFGGCETGSFMSEEIKNARRTIPRALIVSGVILAGSYIAGTIAMLVALPSAEISGVGGFASAIQVMCSRLGLSWIVVVIVLLVALNSIGGAASFLSSTSRLPFVAGIDRYLPKAFGRVHRRWGTPWIAIIFYGFAGMLCALLSQAGSTVQGAYDLLVSMSIVTYFIPFVFLFLAMIRLQREPFPQGGIRFPGGRSVAVLLASVGLITTMLTIVLALVPPDDEPDKGLAIAKILGSTFLLVGAGAAVFLTAKWRRETE